MKTKTIQEETLSDKIESSEDYDVINKADVKEFIKKLKEYIKSRCIYQHKLRLIIEKITVPTEIDNTKPRASPFKIASVIPVI